MAPSKRPSDVTVARAMLSFVLPLKRARVRDSDGQSAPDERRAGFIVPLRSTARILSGVPAYLPMAGASMRKVVAIRNVGDGYGEEAAMGGHTPGRVDQEQGSDLLQLVIDAGEVGVSGPPRLRRAPYEDARPLARR